MSGETNLEVLLTNLQPTLDNGEFVFCTLPDGESFTHLEPKAFIQEAEGISLIMPATNARENGIAFTGTYKAISLTVHSSLEAVGLTAAISTALAESGLSANIVAGYYHDHIFIQSDKADAAMQVIQSLQDHR